MQNFTEKDDFIRIEMSLSDFDLGYSTAGNIASGKLHPCREHLLREICPQTKRTNILADTFFCFQIHCPSPPLRSYKSKCI